MAPAERVAVPIQVLTSTPLSLWMLIGTIFGNVTSLLLWFQSLCGPQRSKSSPIPGKQPTTFTTSRNMSLSPTCSTLIAPASNQMPLSKTWKNQ
ncbi:hypothetical protein BGZ61DRAFT_115327 [Ilyonectria robusta]|uniref:uncharacterized protein n=1 Tax=Ilyonectria robusta TaxID=1079257 RepID=UPI001E8E3890|nr:uncharacterized protein BGZ61DRAFT_115327 [Ilyonectria robusta]KAH8669193.1 hypothetical protein BGZ61DRAFT_115327 [Ilyonectria robusta]